MRSISIFILAFIAFHSTHLVSEEAIDYQKAQEMICQLLDRSSWYANCSFSIAIDPLASDKERERQKEQILESLKLLEVINAYKVFDTTSGSIHVGSYRTGEAYYRLTLSGSLTPATLSSLLQTIHGHLAELGDEISIKLDRVQFRDRDIGNLAETITPRAGWSITVDGESKIAPIAKILSVFETEQDGIKSDSFEMVLSNTD